MRYYQYSIGICSTNYNETLIGNIQAEIHILNIRNILILLKENVETIHLLKACGSGSMYYIHITLFIHVYYVNINSVKVLSV